MNDINVKDESGKGINSKIFPKIPPKQGKQIIQLKVTLFRLIAL